MSSKTEVKVKSKFDTFARVFGVSHIIIAIALIGLALVFEFRKDGDISPAKQATFAHLFLAYACYMFLDAALLLTVVVTYKLFTLYIVLNSLLAILNLVISIVLYASSKSLLSHGTAVQIHDMTSVGLAIIFMVFAILLAVMSVVTGIKLRKLNTQKKRERDQERFQLEVLAAADANEKAAAAAKENDIKIDIPKEVAS